MGRGQQHVRRNVAVRAFQLGQHAADVRILDAALKQPAGLHHLVAGIVNRGGCVIDAADDGVFVGLLRHARKILGDLDARNIGLDGIVRPADLDGGVGLHVPGVELGWPADQEQHDAVRIFVGDRAPCAFMPNKSVSPRPSIDSAPACRKSRRRKPSQNSTGRSASRRNIVQF